MAPGAGWVALSFNLCICFSMGQIVVASESPESLPGASSSSSCLDN